MTRYLSGDGDVYDTEGAEALTAEEIRAAIDDEGMILGRHTAGNEACGRWIAVGGSFTEVPPGVTDEEAAEQHAEQSQRDMQQPWTGGQPGEPPRPSWARG